MDLRTANVTRYILALREGGSLPALAEADDEFKVSSINSIYPLVSDSRTL